MQEQNGPSLSLQNRIFYQSSQDIVPFQIILKKIGIQNVADISNDHFFNRLRFKVQQIQTTLADHLMTQYLTQKGMTIFQNANNYYQQFQHLIQTNMSLHPFYLSKNNPNQFIQQINQTQIAIDESQQSLKWQQRINNISVYINKKQQNLIIKKISQQPNTYQGVKLSQQQQSNDFIVQIGIWKDNRVVRSCLITKQPNQPINIFYRQFQNGKFDGGIVRYIQSGEIKEGKLGKNLQLANQINN